MAYNFSVYVVISFKDVRNDRWIGKCQESEPSRTTGGVSHDAAVLYYAVLGEVGRKALWRIVENRNI